MRLAAKLILLYLLGLLMIVAVFATLTAQNERRLAAAEHGRRSAELVATMRPHLYEPLARGDRVDIERVLRQTTREVRTVEMRYLTPSGQLLTQRSVTTSFVPAGKGDQLVSTVPIANDQQHFGAIEIKSNDDDAEMRLQRALMRSGIALAGATLLSGLVIYIGGIYMVGRPLDQLIEKVERIGNGDFDGDIAIGRRDELGMLGQSINQMCARLKGQRNTIVLQSEEKFRTVQQLRHADRLGSVGRLAAGVAHEMGTPLGVVSGRAELIATGQLQGEQAKQSAAIIKSESDRISSIIRHLLGFARRETGHFESADLIATIEETIELVSPMTEKRNVVIRFEASLESAVVKMDTAQIKQVILNLIENAIESSAKEIQLTLDQNSDGGWDLAIADNGSGMSSEVLEHAFEPFFTTRDVGEGTGLGLSIAYGIIADHGGDISVQSSPGGGTIFQIRFPDPSSFETATSHQTTASVETSVRSKDQAGQ